MKSKWHFKDLTKLENYCIGEDSKIYRKPLTKNNRAYAAKEIKKQKGNRYRLNNEWWSEAQLKPHIILSENPIELFVDKNLPF